MSTTSQPHPASQRSAQAGPENARRVPSSAPANRGWQRFYPAAIGKWWKVIIQGRVDLDLLGTCGDFVDPCISVMEKSKHLKGTTSTSFKCLYPTFCCWLSGARQICRLRKHWKTPVISALSIDCVMVVMVYSLFFGQPRSTPHFSMFHQLLEPPPPPTTEHLQSLGTTTTERLRLSEKKSLCRHRKEVPSYLVVCDLRVYPLDSLWLPTCGPHQMATELGKTPGSGFSDAFHGRSNWELECCYTCLKHRNSRFCMCECEFTCFYHDN